MLKFTTLQGIPAPLNEANVDTDAILPARFLLLLDKAGFGKHLFSERRRDTNFVLNTPPYDTAEILVTGPRFGIGSSREHAVWALSDFGFRCIIAPSFGDIFFANCTKNGVLPICLSADEHKKVMDAAISKDGVSIDLAAQTIAVGSHLIPFDVSPYHKEALLQGLDEIGSILTNDVDDIQAFETKQQQAQPWLYLSKAQLSIFGETKARL